MDTETKTEIPSNVKSAVKTVAFWADSDTDTGIDHGYQPSREPRAPYNQAAVLGLLTIPSGSWGFRLTKAGHAFMVEFEVARKAREVALTAAGFDPNKPISEMTQAEVDAFIASKIGS